jgi:hypothetical protein
MHQKHVLNYRTLAAALSIAALGAMAEVRAEDFSNSAEPIGILLAVGDIARCGSSARHKRDEEVAAIVRGAVKDAESRSIPVRLILLGDLAYDDGTTSEFDKCFDPEWGAFKSISLPVPGNHDYVTRAAAPYFEYFKSEPTRRDGKPLVTSEGDATGYYGLRFPDENGAWLLVGLNPYNRARVSVPSEQWLENLLEDNDAAGPNRAPCILAFAHPYRFSSGFHGHGDVKKKDARLKKSSSLESEYKMLDAHGASVLLSGHDHHFEQFARQDADGNKDPEGVRAFIVGTGGGTLYMQNIGHRYDTNAANQEHLVHDKHGVLRMNLYPDRYSWEFLTSDGAVITPSVNQDSCSPG